MTPDPRPWRVIVLAAALLLATGRAGAGETPVRLRLNYYHQFQFAGYYAADHLGYYRDEGLAVAIDELEPGMHPTDEMLHNRAHFAVGNSEFLGDWAAGKDVFVLAFIHQRNPSVILVREDSPYRTLQDLVDLPRERIVGPTAPYEIELWTGLRLLGRDPDAIFPHRKRPEDFARFVSGELLMLPAYATNEPSRLRRLGIATRMIEISPRRTVFPGDSLLCHGELWRSRPAVVEGFRRASLKGWAYALTHQPELVDHILSRRPSRWQTQDRAQLIEEAVATAELMDADRFPIGDINPARLEAIAGIVSEAGTPLRIPASLVYRSPGDDARSLAWLGGILVVALGGFAGLMWVNRRQRQTLVESRAHFRNLVDMADGYFLFRVSVGADRRINLQLASPSIEPITGHALAHHHAHPDRLAEQIHDDDRAGVRLAVLDAIAAGAPLRIRLRIRHPRHPRPRHLLLHATSSTTARGLEYDGICLDLTAEAEADEERRQLQHQLQLAQRHESLGLLAGGVAHDFNNLLGAIRGNAEMLAPLLPRDANGPRRLQRLLEAVDRASGLVRQILAYTGRGSIESRPLDLAAEIRQLRELLRHSLPENVAIDLDLRDGVPCVTFDPAQFQQVLVNLIVNAADSYEGRPGTVRVVLASDGPRQVRLQVSDRGCGMDRATQARMFEPYFTTKERGHGLGLAAVQGIIRKIGGVLDCQSEPGVGTTFTLVFASSDGAVVRVPTPLPTTAANAARTILIADDDELMREITAEMLKSLGYDTLVVAGGIPARDLLRQRRDDIAGAVIDYRMPDLDGLSLLRDLRARRDHLPVILMSGMTSGENLAAELTGSRTRFLAKPFTQEQLGAMLHGLLAGSRRPASDSNHSALALAKALGRSASSGDGDAMG